MRFVVDDAPADVAVVVVTYQSEAVIGELLASLRRQAGTHRLRVIVADNASTDGTVRLLAAHPDVTTVMVGGNLGYAAGINAAARASVRPEPLLVLNPDLELAEGAIAALLERMQDSEAAIVVPRILDSEGQTYPSLRREPSLLGALGDALFGNRLAGRPGRLSETVLTPSAYDRPHPIDWATGAALLIDRSTAELVGEWDETFFLYSEETDFFRRVRQLGRAAWYEPTAVVRHHQGGSGTSLELEKLLVVNRIRYARKHHGRVYAGAYRCMVALREILRCYNASHRAILAAVLLQRRWSALPGPSRGGPLKESG